MQKWTTEEHTDHLVWQLEKGRNKCRVNVAGSSHRDSSQGMEPLVQIAGPTTSAIRTDKVYWCVGTHSPREH